MRESYMGSRTGLKRRSAEGVCVGQGKKYEEGIEKETKGGNLFEGESSQKECL